MLKHHAEAARERLKQVALDGGLYYDQLLRRYAGERVLRRLLASTAAGGFVLRGGSAVEARLGVPHRLLDATELRGRPGTTAPQLRSMIRDLAADLVRDGLLLDGGSVRARRVRQRPGETAIEMVATLSLHGAQIPLKLQVTLHDTVRPPAETLSLPVLLRASEVEVPVLRYESLMADCVHGLLQRGTAHARMSDLYDAWLIGQVDPLEDLDQALEDVLRVHGTPVPAQIPPVFDDVFARSAHAERHWDAFVRKARPTTPVDLIMALEQVREQVLPILDDLD